MFTDKLPSAFLLCKLERLFKMFFLKQFRQNICTSYWSQCHCWFTGKVFLGNVFKAQNKQITFFIKTTYTLLTQWKNQNILWHTLLYTACLRNQVRTCKLTSSITQSSVLPFTVRPWLPPFSQKTSTEAFISLTISSNSTWTNTERNKRVRFQVKLD